MWWLLPIVPYGRWALLLYASQRRLLFPGTGLEAPVAAGEVVPGLERLWLRAPGGNVEAWYLPPGGTRPPPRPAVIFSHGNYELIDFWAHGFEGLRERGVGVLLVEFPGYGRSGGMPGEGSLAGALEAAFDTLAARPGVDGARIVAWGRSVGGGAACALAARRPVAALVLQSTFTGVGALAARHLVPPILVRDPFDNLAVVRSFGGPVLVAHGRGDRIVPFSHGEALARAASHGTLLAYDCAHNDCPPDWQGFIEEVARFLETHGLLDEAGGAPRSVR